MALDRKNYQELYDFVDTWSSGDEKLKSILTKTVTDFIMRYGIYTIDDPTKKIKRMLRIFKGTCIIDQNDFIKSSENFIIRDSRKFFLNEDEKEITLAKASWDNKASFFVNTSFNKKTKTLFQFENIFKDLEDDYVRLFEYPLNFLLKENPLKELILQNSKSDNKNALLHMVPNMEQEFRQIWSNIFMTEYKKNRELFLSNITTLSVLQSIGYNNISDHNWLMGSYPNRTDECKNTNISIGTARQQFIELYPLLYQIVKSPSLPFCQKIDNLLPVTKDLSNYYNVPELTIKQIKHLKREYTLRNYEIDAKTFPEILKRINILPKGKIPNNEDSWKTFFSLTDTVLELVKYEDVLLNTMPETILTNDDLFEKAKIFLSHFSNKWDDFNYNTLITLSDNFSDILTELDTIFFKNIAHNSKIKWNTKRFYDFFIKGHNPVKLIESLCWWISNKEIILSNILTAIDKNIMHKLEWEPLVEPKEERDKDTIIKNYNYTMSNNLVMVPLINNIMLKKEGECMKHCVGTYVPQCLFHGVHIISIRNKQNESLATFEIQESKLFEMIQEGYITQHFNNKNQLPSCVIQCQGKNNSNPSPECIYAMNEYIEKIVFKILKVNNEKITNARIERNKNKNNYMTQIEKQNSVILTQEEINFIWRQLEPLLPKQHFKKGVDSLKKNNITQMNEKDIEIGIKP